MKEESRDVAVQIVRFVDAHNPGVVECTLIDAEGVTHSFIDKVPIFTNEMLVADSLYPQPGSLGCTILAQWQDSKGRSLMRINTIESTEGLSAFVVLSAQLSEAT
jgi:hypothetical protein